MAEAQAKVRMTLDGQQFNQQMDRAGKQVKTVGQEIGQWGNGLAKTLALSGALLGTIKQIAAAQAEARRASAEASRTQGSAALSLGVSMAKLGVTGARAQAVEGIAELAPQDVASAFSGVKKLHRNADVVGAAKAAQLGIFTSDEIQSSLETGKPLDIAGRLAQLSPAAINEIKVRQSEQLTAYRTRGAANTDERLNEAELAARRIESPALQSLADSAETISQFVGITQSSTISGQRSGRPSLSKRVLMALLGEDGPEQIDRLFENGPSFKFLDNFISPNRNMPQRVEVVNPRPVTGARGEQVK